MNIAPVVQDDLQWHALRAKSFTASEAPAMLGLSPYKTRAELLREKATGIIPEVDPTTQARFDAGHASEAAARPIVEARLGTELFPATATLVVDGLPLLASFDGVSMDESIVWENKLANGQNVGDLALAVDEQHWPQLEQQALVAGVDRVYFTVSDGTEDGTPGVWYHSQPERRANLIAGWKQFRDDLANYQHVEEAPKLVGRAPETLPALRIEVTGMVTASNLKEFKEHALAVIAAINTDLQTDEHFADAEKAIKWAGEVEDRLDAAKQHALSQTASIDELFRAIDEIKSDARQKRLNLEKLVKARKEQIRREIVDQAATALATHITSLNRRIGYPYMPAPDYTRFGIVIKGLKTLTSLRDAVATELANAKIASSAIADQIELNLKTLREFGEGYGFLFNDVAMIVQKQPDDLTALVKSRVADHEAAEEKRLEAERERIRKEEEAKAEARRLAEERERIRQEQAKTADALAFTTTLPVAPPSQPVASAPAPEEPAAPKPSRSELLVSLYISRLADSPKKKAELKKHLLAFMAFCRQQAEAA